MAVAVAAIVVVIAVVVIAVTHHHDGCYNYETKQWTNCPRRDG